MNFEYIHLSGGLFSPDFLESIDEKTGQAPSDFCLDNKLSVLEQISKSYSFLLHLIEVFENRKSKLKNTDSLVSITREHWMIPVLEEFNFSLQFQSKHIVVGDRRFPISHRDGTTDNKGVLVHIIGYDEDLDKTKTEISNINSSKFSSAHSLMQDYLNRTDDDLWGIITNGRLIRILRNSSFFTKQPYIEFDLESILRNKKFEEFKVLFRILHRTRFPKPDQLPSECILETYRQQAINEGGRIRDGLRSAVENSIELIGNGFIQNKLNFELKSKILSKEISPKVFYQQILYLIYRILFLFTAEERNLILVSKDNPISKEFLLKKYRDRSRRFDISEKNFVDIYQNLKSLFLIYRDASLSKLAGFPPLNGELFKEYSIIDSFHLDNATVLRVFHSLSYFKPEKEKTLRRVNYSALDVEELGSVYESLLDFYPRLDIHNDKIEFYLGAGTERKSTGSHYTHHDLVIETIKTSLVPVLQDRLEKSKNSSQKQKEEAILSIKVCDPACGSGHFLLAASRILGKELARIRSGADEPAPSVLRDSIRDVISHCIYGVDKNPLAVDLCKVALWMEGYSEGKPLTFLDHRIRCGDSLVGVYNMDCLADGIFEGAYQPITGDDKKIAQSYKKQNQMEISGEEYLISVQEPGNQILFHSISILREIESTEDADPILVNEKKSKYDAMKSDELYVRQRLACDIWTYSFFQYYTEEHKKKGLIATTEDLRNILTGGTISKDLKELATQVSLENRFFHWCLEFPDVLGVGNMGVGNFDVILGNPPWERIKLQEKEFFATRDTAIANAQNKSMREGLIQNLHKKNPLLLEEFQKAKHYADANSKFIRESARFPLTAVGDINTYAVFSELCRSLIGNSGKNELEMKRVGIIVPTGIATDDTCKRFFGDLVEKKNLVSIYDFENRKKLFLEVDSRMKYTILSLSSKQNEEVQFSFFLTQPSDLKDERRLFTLSAKEIALINPNTKTCPVFRTKLDAELTKFVYKYYSDNFSKLFFKQSAMFHSMNHAYLLTDENTLIKKGFKKNTNCFTIDEKIYYPVLEGKSFSAYDHRFANVILTNNTNRPYQPLETNENEYKNPFYVINPRAWVIEDEVDNWYKSNNIKYKWFLVYKKITSSTNERTLITSIIPKSAALDTVHILIPKNNLALNNICIISLLNSLIFDYFVRQKIGGNSINFYSFEQFPFFLQKESFNSLTLRR